MKLYRGFYPHRVRTDRKQPGEYISDWKEDNRIWLKGTKTFGAERETDLFLEIEEADVLALFYGLLERHQNSPSPKTLEFCTEAMTRLAQTCQKAVSEMDIQPKAETESAFVTVLEGLEGPNS